MLPSADAMYACDPHWWDYHHKNVIGNFQGQMWTQSKDAAQKYNVSHIPGESQAGLGRNVIHFGGNSGYQAINLAYIFGARKIVLLGYDMQMTNGRQHYFGQHPYHKNAQGPNARLFQNWLKKFDELARDLKKENVQVINATKQSALNCFYKGFIESC